MKQERAYLFYQWTTNELEKHFDVFSNTGLSTRTASYRLAKYGKNSLSELKGTSWAEILLRQFGNFFMLLLFLAAVISYFIDGPLQALIIIAIILANVLLGFLQEFKAEKALNNLKNSVVIKSKVLRDGDVVTISNDQLVIGDIVLLDSGDIIPADLRVIESSALQVNESALTGESVPVDKDSNVLPIETILADRTNMLFASTIVTAGHGKGIVVETGRKTEFGKIAGLIAQENNKTPLEIQTAYIAKTLTAISVVVIFFLFLFGWFRGYETLPLLTFVIALLVGAVPESLPTIITLALAIGVSRMAKHKAIVRRLAAVETLGTVKLIATDKTGTLTNNELTINTVVSSNFNIISPVKKTLNVEKLLSMAALCSNTASGSKDIIGDPLEVAILRKATELKIKNKKHKRLLEIPFDSENQYMAVLVAKGTQKELIVKGAPEKIASFCKGSATARKIRQLAKKLSANGLKVIAVASKVVDKKSFSDMNGLCFLGLIGMVDEPTEGIKEAIEKTIKANINPVILTGDHPETARYVAANLGLAIADDEIMTGADLKKLSEYDLKKALSQVKIFARISPEDKINIVDRLEKLNFPVIVTGDGVNDAAAIKRASVGVAMGIKGTELAKDSADIILSDDRYATIVSAIEYGRAVYDNIKNAIIFLISGNIDEICLVGIAFILNLPMPLLTVQILWINMITDTLPALALAFEKPSPEVIKEHPRSAQAGSMRMPIIYSLYLAAIGLIIGLALFLWGLNISIEKARTLVFNFAVFQEVVFVFSVRSPKRIWENAKSFFTNSYLNYSLFGVVALQLLIFTKPFAKVFHLVPLKLTEILVLIGMIALTFILSELVRSKLKSKLEQV